MFLRINQCSIFSAYQLPTCKLVSILRVRSLACLILRILSRITIVVYRLSIERIYSVIRVLPSYRVLARYRLEYRNVGYVRSHCAFPRINQCSICSACQLPTLEPVIILSVRSLACLILRILSRITIVVYRLSIERIYSVIRVLPSYGIRIRNPLCIQIQIGHQNSSRIRKFVGACCFGIPTTKGVTLRSLKRITATNSIGVATRLVIYDRILVLSRNSISGIVGIISDINRNALEIAINMDILYSPPAIAPTLVLNGIPYNGNTIRMKREIRGIKQRLSGGLISIGVLSIGAIIIPVARSEETEIFRFFQICFVNTILDVSDRICACVSKRLHTFCGYKTLVTSNRIQTLYATVAALGTGSLVIAARQVVCLTLVIVVLRRTTLRQKYEVLGCLLPIPCAVALDLLHANCIRRRIAYCIIILRIIFIGIAIIASLLDVRTAGRCLCRILSLRLSLGPSIGSLNGVFCGSTVNNRHLVFRCRKGGDAFITGQRPGRAHGQRHDSRKCSCEQTFTHILF